MAAFEANRVKFTWAIDSY